MLVEDSGICVVKFNNALSDTVPWFHTMTLFEQ